jgi:hypothetical protein
MLMADVSLFSLWTMAIVKNAHRAQDETHPFGEIDLRSADLDALAPRFQRSPRRLSE